MKTVIKLILIIIVLLVLIFNLAAAVPAFGPTTETPPSLAGIGVAGPVSSGPRPSGSSWTRP